MSSDPGDIHETIDSLITDRIRVSIVGLAAQVAICDELCSKTHGGDNSGYSIALHEQHFRDLLLDVTTPPATRAKEKSNASLLMMGFPSRSIAAGDSATLNYCACHNRPTREGYACTRCGSRVCRLPAECPACGLTLILSTHLARSYHHLFPLRNWVEVPWSEAGKSKNCFSCLAPFPDPPKGKSRQNGTKEGGKHGGGAAAVEGLSESARYACQVCGYHFCIDCDLYAHEMLHNCPGCQSDTRKQTGPGGETNGQPNRAVEVGS